MRKPITSAILAALVAAGGITATAHAGPTPADDMLLFSAQPFDTQRDTLAPPMPFSLQPAAAGLQIVQFNDTIQPNWLDALKARGITPIQYVANNGYIVWADQDALARLASLRDADSFTRASAAVCSRIRPTTPRST